MITNDQVKQHVLENLNAMAKLASNRNMGAIMEQLMGCYSVITRLDANAPATGALDHSEQVTQGE